MTRASVLVGAVLLAGLAATQSGAQQPDAGQHHAGPQTEAIKALTEQQLADLRAGRGMGLALAAELNGYPGPSHVLEQAAALDLSPDQRHRTAALFDAMKAEAVPLGEQLIRQEGELDRLFATRTATPEALEAATGAIGATHGALRAVHLRYHLVMLEVLTREQVRRYAELRGQGAARHGRREGVSPH